jgi:thiol-disulfide isomerase/thioredoxin
MPQGTEPGDPRAAPRRRLPIAVLAAVLLALAGAAFLLLRDGDGGSPPRRVPFEIARSDLPAPPIQLPMPDGKSFSLADARGQVVVVNFWATWCPPCRDEMPSMLKLARELTARHPGKFRMVAVTVDEGWEVVREFFGGPMPPEIAVALDAGQETTRAYYCGARGACPESIKFPETYVVDRAGRLVAYMVGPRDWSDPAARQFLEQLIDR